MHCQQMIKEKKNRVKREITKCAFFGGLNLEVTADDESDIDDLEDEARIIGIANSDDKSTNTEEHKHPAPFAPPVQSQLYAQHVMQVAERSKIFNSGEIDAWQVQQSSVQRETDRRMNVH